MIKIIKEDEQIIIKDSGVYEYKFNSSKKLNLNIKVLKNIDVKIFSYTDESVNLNLNISLEENSSLKNYFVFTEECETDYKIDLNGENANFEYNLICYGDKIHLQSHKVLINHLKPNTKSLIVNRGVLDDEASLVLDITSSIKKGCYKADTYQSSKVISLSDYIKVKINPILLIDEFDVSGGHSASVSKITDDDLYYLNTRGINKKEAKNLIAFGNLLENIPEEYMEEIKNNLEVRING